MSAANMRPRSRGPVGGAGTDRPRVAFRRVPEQRRPAPAAETAAQQRFGGRTSGPAQRGTVIDLDVRHAGGGGRALVAVPAPALDAVAEQDVAQWAAHDLGTGLRFAGIPAGDLRLSPAGG